MYAEFRYLSQGRSQVTFCRTAVAKETATPFSLQTYLSIRLLDIIYQTQG